MERSNKRVDSSEKRSDDKTGCEADRNSLELRDGILEEIQLMAAKERKELRDFSKGFPRRTLRASRFAKHAYLFAFQASRHKTQDMMGTGI